MKQQEKNQEQKEKKVSFLKKAKNFLKENKLKVIIGAVVAANTYTTIKSLSEVKKLKGELDEAKNQRNALAKVNYSLQEEVKKASYHLGKQDGTSFKRSRHFHRNNNHLS